MIKLVVIFHFWRELLAIYFGNIRAALWMLRRALRGDTFIIDFTIDTGPDGRKYVLNILTHIKENTVCNSNSNSR